MARHRRKSNDEETSYWLSYSDMMAALLLIFVLIISFTMMQAKKQYEEKEQELYSQQELIEQQQAQMEAQQKQLDNIIGIRGELIEALRDEFEDSELSVYVDPQTGAITFDSSVLFDSNEFKVEEAGEKFLNEFLPRYFNVLLEDGFREYVSEIIIEGHTDTRSDYMYNLELSQQRALSVAKYCLDEESAIIPAGKIKELQSIVTANGRSYSNPIYNDDGTVNMDASRRVEFKFRLKDEEMVEEMIKILNNGESGN